MNSIQRLVPQNEGFLVEMVFKDTKKPNRELPDHCHDWFELVYVYAGSGIIFIDKHLYEMEPGSLFLIPPHTLHHTTPCSDNPITSTALFFNSVAIPQIYSGDSFSIWNCFEDAKRCKNYKVRLKEEARGVLEAQLESMEQERLRSSPGHRQAILLHLSQILLQLTRECPIERERDALPIAAGWMKEVICYIDCHLQADLSLSTLVDKYCISPPHLSRTFKKTTGLTVTEYVNTKRILKAVKLLQSTSQSVSEIAFDCGMNSLPHFHRTFKKVTGVTPAYFRRRLYLEEGEIQYGEA